jgi:RNA polymerase sigma-70 factor (ECF subfamily)
MTTVDIRPAVPAQRSAPTDEAAAAGWALIERSQAGDTEAFADLYRRYRGPVLRFVRYRLPGQTLTLAEDLTHDVFVRALRGLANVTWQGRDPQAWLVTIARNLVADYFKSARQRLEHSVGDIHDHDRVDADPSPARQLIAAEVAAALRTAIDGLSPEQRQCVELRYFAGLTVAETAAAMGRNDGAVKALQYRAVRALARALPNREEWR